MKKIIPFLFCFFVMFSGCQKPHIVPDQDTYRTHALNRDDERLGYYPFGKVSISFTEEAQKKHLENESFETEKLINQTKMTLSKNLSSDSYSEKMPAALEILIKDMHIRSSMVYALTGLLGGSDSLLADVIQKNKKGEEYNRFEVSVSSSISDEIWIKPVLMRKLYTRFANKILLELSKN